MIKSTERRNWSMPEKYRCGIYPSSSSSLSSCQSSNKISIIIKKSPLIQEDQMVEIDPTDSPSSLFLEGLIYSFDSNYLNESDNNNISNFNMTVNVNSKVKMVSNGRILSPALSFAFQGIQNGDSIFILPIDIDRRSEEMLLSSTQSRQRKRRINSFGNNDLSTTNFIDISKAPFHEASYNIENYSNSNNKDNNNIEKENNKSIWLDADHEYCPTPISASLHSVGPITSEGKSRMLARLRERFDLQWAEKFRDPDAVFEQIKDASDPTTALESARLADVYRIRVEENSAAYRKVCYRFEKMEGPGKANTNVPNAQTTMKHCYRSQTPASIISSNITVIPKRSLTPSSSPLPNYLMGVSSTGPIQSNQFVSFDLI